MVAATSLTSSPLRLRQLLKLFKVAMALSIWVLGLILVVAWFLLTLILFSSFPVPCTVSAGLLVALMFAPLDIPPPRFIRRFLHYSLSTAFSYFSLTMIYEDKDALRAGRPYILGYEPHGVIPFLMAAFSEYAADASTPPGLAHSRILVSSAGFLAPVMRHLWYWLGCRPVSKHVVKKLLAKGSPVVLCPGGVRECMYMQPGTEVAYLRKRRGFIKLALEHRAPSPAPPAVASSSRDTFDEASCSIW